MDQAAWLKQFLGERNLEWPDGRALYTYKCTQSEYDTARSLTGQMLLGTLRGGYYYRRRFAEIFCLFAAETWQREYAGGVWNYQPIFSALETQVPDQNRVRDWIEQGLEWWRRTIIRSGSGNQYLLTIGCEGGLPVRLLRDADTRLSAYFRELLTALDREPGIALEDLARREMARLPISLRRDVVFEVSAQLVRAIAELQSLTAGAEDPIRALDRAQPEWREQLPLPLGNQAVEMLLGKLVRHAQGLKEKKHGGAPIAWRRGLDERNGDRFLFAALELPDDLAPEQVAKWTDRDPPPPRLRLLLSVADQTRTVAVLSRVKTPDGAETYRCERLNRQGVRLIGRSARQPTRLILTDGTHDWPFEVPGDQGLERLPWVFHDAQQGDISRFLGEGSVRSRQPTLILAVNPDDRVEARSEDTVIEPIGELTRVERKLYWIGGRVAVIAPSGETCGIHCGSDRDSTGSYHLLGKQLPWVLDERPVYCGMPGVRLLEADEVTDRTITQGIQWRPGDSGEAIWRDDTQTALGQVWLRCVDPETGDLLMRRRIDLVPAGCRVDLRIGTPARPGSIELQALEGAQVRSRDPSVAVDPEGSGVRVRLSEPTRTIDAVPLELTWPGRTPIRIRLPAPQRGGAFLSGGRPLPNDAPVALERLGGTRVVARTPATGDRFLVDAEVCGKGSADPDLKRLLWVRLPLADKGEGAYEASLHGLQERLAALLAMVAGLDARATLVLRDTTQQELARIQVARYDLVLEPRREQARVVIPKQDLERIGEDWEDHIGLEMIRLWDPEHPPRPLERVDPVENTPWSILKPLASDPPTYPEEGAAWSIPPDLAPGPWWVIGRDGGWARFRPLLWTASAPEEEAAGEERSPLVAAVREPDPERRERLLGELIRGLATDAAAPDWERLLGYLPLTREHPAHSLEVITTLGQCREALALMLFRASGEENDFDLAWSLADQLPFAWYLLPADCWMAAAKAHFDQLREVLSNIDGGDAILAQIFTGFRDRTAGRLPGSSILCDWLQEAIFPDIPLQDKTLIQTRAAPERMAELAAGRVSVLRGELQGRLDTDARWPEAPRVLEQASRLPQPVCFEETASYRRGLLCAPFVAAGIFTQDWPCTPALALELGRLRAFDHQWFDQVFSTQIGLGLA